MNLTKSRIPTHSSCEIRLIVHMQAVLIPLLSDISGTLRNKI